jgi:hypothetical protein
VGTFGLELGDFLAEHEGLRSENPIDSFKNFSRNRLMLSDEIDEGNGRIRRVCGLRTRNGSHAAAPSGTK